MARIRTIKPEFWTDSKTGTLSTLAKSVFLGLLNHCDDYGVIRFDLMEFKARILPYEKGDVSDVLAAPLVSEIFPRGLASIFSIDSIQYLHVTHFERHQKVDKPGKPIIQGWKAGMTPHDFGLNCEEYQDLGPDCLGIDQQDSGNTREASRKNPLEGKGRERKGSGKEGISPPPVEISTTRMTLREIRTVYREMIGVEPGGGLNQSLTEICQTYTPETINHALLATSTRVPKPVNPFLYLLSVLRGESDRASPSDGFDPTKDYPEGSFYAALKAEEEEKDR